MASWLLNFLCLGYGVYDMSDSEKPIVYLILGAARSGRREVLADLIDVGLDETDHAAVLLSDTEAAHDLDAELPNVTRWAWQEGFIAAELPEGASHVFFVTDGRRDPVDQIEAFKAWLATQGAELARILCVINCQLAEKHPPLLAWYEAGVHFADVALLHKRDGVDNKWLSDFLAHFKKKYYPCLFEYVKAGRVHNPALILAPQARRMTHVFDEEQDWIFTNAEGEEVDEEEESEGEEEIEAAPAEDPYFARKIGGRRVKELPDITKFL